MRSSGSRNDGRPKVIVVDGSLGKSGEVGAIGQAVVAFGSVERRLRLTEKISSCLP
jgi:hypothetical protein